MIQTDFPLQRLSSPNFMGHGTITMNFCYEDINHPFSVAKGILTQKDCILIK
jgi:hypothetical protein